MDKFRLLVIRLSALGDVVHTLPAVARVKQLHPETHVTWIVEQAFADILQNNPLVDEVIIFPKKALAADLKNPLTWLKSDSQVKRFLAELRSRKFNAAIDFQGLFKSGAIAFLSGAPIRVGFTQSREFSDRFLTHKLDADYFSHDIHVIDHNVALAEFLLRIACGTSAEFSGTVDFPLPSPGEEVFARIQQKVFGDRQTAMLQMRSDDQKKSEKLDVPNYSSMEPSVEAKSNSQLEPPAEAETTPRIEPAVEAERGGKKGRPTIVFIPGTTWITKIWPREKWVDLGINLLKKHDVRIVLIGGRAETETNQYIYDRILEANVENKNVVNLTNQTSLIDLVALFSLVDLAVGPDCGPLHMAAAVGHPACIGIFGSTPWRRLAPYGHTSSVVALDIECQPCYQAKCRFNTVACLTDLNPELVLQKIESSLLNRT